MAKKIGNFRLREYILQKAMPYNRKKQEHSEELIRKKAQLVSLKKIVMAVGLCNSEDELKLIVEKELHNLCQVDVIVFQARKPSSKSSKYIYQYSFTYNNNTYFILFKKESGILKTEKWFLKNTGKTLESAIVRLEQQKNLKINKEQWELAFDIIATPICLVDLQGNILRTNKTFREKTKMSKQELLQKNYFTVFFGKEKASLLTQQSNTKKTREKRLINGKEETFEISVQKILQNTETEIILVILRDITEQIKVENQIAESAKSAEMGIISSSIAHELNNPIAGIQALLQNLQMQNLDKNISEDLKEMSLAIQRCTHIINKLLNIHR